MDDGDVAERIRPVGVRAGDVDVGLGRHPDVTDRMRADEAVEAVLLRNLLGVAEVLDDLERVPERQHLDVRHVLDDVGDRLQLAVVVEGDAVRVAGLLLDLEVPRSERAEPRLDLSLVVLEPLLELEVARVVRVGQRVPHDDRVLYLAVQRVSGRVRPAMLHRLEHRRHVVPDGVGAPVVAIDDSGDPAHQRAPVVTAGCPGTSRAPSP